MWPGALIAQSRLLVTRATTHASHGWMEFILKGMCSCNMQHVHSAVGVGKQQQCRRRHSQELELVKRGGAGPWMQPPPTVFSSRSAHFGATVWTGTSSARPGSVMMSGSTSFFHFSISSSHFNYFLLELALLWKKFCNILVKLFVWIRPVSSLASSFISQ